MIERPIIFSPDMVCALITGSKTMTRRIVKPNYTAGDLLWVRENWQPIGFPESDWLLNDQDVYKVNFPADGTEHQILLSNYSFKQHYCAMLYREFEGKEIAYDASIDSDGDNCPIFKVRPSIHLFKEFARIWLRVKGVRLERLQDITSTDAIAEGIKVLDPKLIVGQKKTVYVDYLDSNAATDDPIESFKTLFIKIHGATIWNQNPYISVTDFDVVSTNGL